MKKTTYLAQVFFIAIAMLLVSCDKDKEASPLSIDLSKTATVKGYLFADLDKTSAGLEEVPEGTEVILSVNHSYLNSASTGVWKDTVEVDANGSFEASVPADDDGVQVQVIALPFEYLQVQEFGSYDSDVNAVYTSSTSTISLSSNEIEIVQISYSFNLLDNYVKMVEVSGEIQANLNDTIAGQEPVASGTIFTFHNSSWSESFSTTADGEFTAVVPVNQSIYLDIEFEAGKVVWDNDAAEYVEMTYSYKLTNNNIGSFSASSEGLVISLGEGELVE